MGAGELPARARARRSAGQARAAARCGGVFDRAPAPHERRAARSRATGASSQVDPGAPELERLLELLRERADVARPDHGAHRAADLARGRARTPTATAMVPLLLERATVLHGLGDTDAAMADLDALLERAASHVEALRFRADLAFNAGDVELAVALWRRYLAGRDPPAPARARSSSSSRRCSPRTSTTSPARSRTSSAWSRRTPTTSQLRERLLGLCLRANDWERATRELRALARLRPTPQEKAREELRLGLMLRDRLDDRGGRAAGARSRAHARSAQPRRRPRARRAARAARRARRCWRRPRRASATSIAQSPRSAVLYERLAQVTGWQSDVDARWLALVGLEALGTPVGRSAPGARAGPPAARRADRGSSSTRRIATRCAAARLGPLARAVARDRAGGAGRDRRRCRQARLRPRRRDRAQEARRQVRAARDRARVLRRRGRRDLHQRRARRDRARARRRDADPVHRRGRRGRGDAAASLPARTRGRDRSPRGWRRCRSCATASSAGRSPRRCAPSRSRPSRRRSPSTSSARTRRSPSARRS